MENDQTLVRIFLAEESERVPEKLQILFLDFETLWERRLWHQLTEKLLEFFADPESAPHRLAIYEKFVLSFWTKINALKLVELALSASSQIQDNNEVVTFLTAVKERVQVKDKEKANAPNSQDAYVYATVETARVKQLLGDLDGSRLALNEAEKILDHFDAIEPVVHASFYRVNADYYLHKSEFTNYYRNALLYLACVSVNDLTLEDQVRRAYNLSVAALLSRDIYNFGELLLHPVLDSLKDTPHAWLREVLFAFNTGDLRKFNGLSGNLSKEPQFSGQDTFLKEKIYLNALTETVARRPPHERTLPFDVIQQETTVGPNEVELLLMRALSLKLVRGTIDQVAEVVRITWVQPKVLDKDQIENMRLRLNEWNDGVEKLTTRVHSKMEVESVF